MEIVSVWLAKYWYAIWGFFCTLMIAVVLIRLRKKKARLSARTYDVPVRPTLLAIVIVGIIIWLTVQVK